MGPRGRPKPWRDALAAILLVSAALSGCGATPPEQALRERMSDLQAGIDDRDVVRIEDLLAEDFVGNDGMDRQGARRLAAGTFLRFRDVGVRIGPLDIEFHGDARATLRFEAFATGGSGGLLPEQGQVYEVATGWRLEDGEWRMSSADWKPRL